MFTGTVCRLMFSASLLKCGLTELLDLSGNSGAPIFMIAIEQIDVRQPILESTDFGNDQIKTILRALAEGQAAEVRQA
ncbi:MAG TPA: hypothetical protein DD473_01420, partial [Planctomycetaceae bacterium]|nr:hypothetical protein [Planctomycetaceae bacterium]